MIQRYLIVFLGLLSFCHGQSGNPEDAIPNFDLDDYYVEPKFTMHVGVRMLSGAKTSFGGQGGIVSSYSQLQGAQETGVVRGYHDGSVFLNQREGVSDGKTNNWSYVDPRQVLNDGADVAFHVYTAEITDSKIRRDDPGSSLGSELVLSRDMGNFGKRISWMLTAGLGMNGIQASARDNVMANYKTVTDTYTLDGQTLPATVPYAPPTYTIDADGKLVETSVLMGDHPDSRTESTVATDARVSNFWKLRGTYLTLRLGPTVMFSFTDKLKFTVSGGPALVYSGTTYAVQQTLTVDTSDPIVRTVDSSEGKTMTGYYADASLEYLLSETAGLYLGAFYQTSGDYTQGITENASSYTLDVDLSRLQGFRGGLNFKF